MSEQKGCFSKHIYQHNNLPTFVTRTATFIIGQSNGHTGQVWAELNFSQNNERCLIKAI